MNTYPKSQQSKSTNTAQSTLLQWQRHQYFSAKCYCVYKHKDTQHTYLYITFLQSKMPHNTYATYELFLKFAWNNQKIQNKATIIFCSKVGRKTKFCFFSKQTQHVQNYTVFEVGIFWYWNVLNIPKKYSLRFGGLLSGKWSIQ